jgi:hypothetical protein
MNCKRRQKVHGIVTFNVECVILSMKRRLILSFFSKCALFPNDCHNGINVLKYLENTYNLTNNDSSNTDTSSAFMAADICTLRKA